MGRWLRYRAHDNHIHVYVIMPQDPALQVTKYSMSKSHDGYDQIAIWPGPQDTIISSMFNSPVLLVEISSSFSRIGKIVIWLIAHVQDIWWSVGYQCVQVPSFLMTIPPIAGP